jgi:arylsulfatase A-like enzyme
LIVITSDHGEEFQEHGGLLHGRTQYQEVLRVPLILAGPGVPAGVVVDQPVHGVDVAPTLLARCGLAPARPVDGIDLAPAWRGEMLPERLFFAEADHNNQVDGRPALDIKKMVRRGTSKLLLDTHSGAVELYDLAQDPGELADLAPTAEARASELRAELERFLEGAVQGEVVAPPTPEQQSVLDALGYGGGIEEE